MIHKDLEVWKKSIEFVTSIYSLTKPFPKDEMFSLVSQMRRSAVSIPSNIAEGATRKGRAEFKHFLHIAMASGAELETQIIISGNLDYISNEKQELAIKELNTISKMIQGLIKSLG